MIKLLFVCIENSNRSQMAEAFAKIHGKAGIQSFSAGSRPSGIVNPKAIAAMQAVGYDMSSHSSKSVDQFLQEHFDYVIGMGCGDECPMIPANHRLEWAITDPKNLEADQFYLIRDEIEAKVKALLQSLKV
ncbi:MAG: arsenate reductase ArsC [Bacteroidetes bacterium]|nr:arsenate reductase ArsC [Bacteroidota bacterium]